MLNPFEENPESEAMECFTGNITTTRKRKFIIGINPGCHGSDYRCSVYRHKRRICLQHKMIRSQPRGFSLCLQMIAATEGLLGLLLVLHQSPFRLLSLKDKEGRFVSKLLRFKEPYASLRSFMVQSLKDPLISVLH